MRTYNQIAIVIGLLVHIITVAILATLTVPVPKEASLSGSLELFVDASELAKPRQAAATALFLQVDPPGVTDDLHGATKLVQPEVRVSKLSTERQVERVTIDSFQNFDTAPKTCRNLPLASRISLARNLTSNIEKTVRRSAAHVPRTQVAANVVTTPAIVHRLPIQIVYSREPRKPKVARLREPSAAEQASFDRPAKPLPGNPLPNYPSGIYFRGQGGVCEIEVQVSHNGRVTSLRIARSSGIDWLDRSALSAVSQWHFTPAMRNGAAAASTVTVPVSFSVFGN